MNGSWHITEADELNARLLLDTMFDKYREELFLRDVWHGMVKTVEFTKPKDFGLSYNSYYSMRDYAINRVGSLWKTRDGYRYMNAAYKYLHDNFLVTWSDFIPKEHYTAFTYLYADGYGNVDKANSIGELDDLYMNAFGFDTRADMVRIEMPDLSDSERAGVLSSMNRDYERAYPTPAKIVSVLRRFSMPYEVFFHD